MNKASKKILKHIIQITVILIIFYFFAERIFSSWNQLQSYDFRINFAYFVLSLVLLSLGFFLMSLGWRNILRNLKEKIGIKKAFFIWAKSEMAKYIPGMVWTAVGRVYLIKKNKAKTFLSVLIEIGMKVISSLIVSLILIYPLIKDVVNVYFIIVLIILGLIAAHPSVFQKVLNLGIKIIKKDSIKIKIKYSAMLHILLIYIVSWFIIGSGFSLMVFSLYPIDFSLIIPTIGIFCISWAAGFLFLIMPGGIGVREAMIVLLFQNYIPATIAIIISIIGRIWWTLGDILVLLAAKIVNKTHPPR
jgi:uncharacterized membrane protein YbhN (UPF0104 family)